MNMNGAYCSFVWNEHGICTNPLVYRWERKKPRLILKVAVAERDGKWFAQDSVQHGNLGAVGSGGWSGGVSHRRSVSDHSGHEVIILALNAARATCSRDGLPLHIDKFIADTRTRVLSDTDVPVPTQRTTGTTESFDGASPSSPTTEQDTNMSSNSDTVLDSGEAFLDAVTGAGQAQEAPTLKAPSSVAPRAAEDGGALEVVSTGPVANTRDAAAGISEAFARAKGMVVSAAREVVFCGLLMAEQKAQLKHGQFLKWLGKHCPEIPTRTAQQWMQVAESAVCLAANAESLDQMRNGCVFSKLPVSNLLQLPPAELPEPAVAVQSRLLELVDGKTQKQLRLEFKDLEPKGRGGDNTPRDADGKRIQKGWGAKHAPDKEGAEELVRLYCQKIRFLREGQSLALIGDALLNELETERVELGHAIRAIRDSRKKTKR